MGNVFVKADAATGFWLPIQIYPYLQFAPSAWTVQMALWLAT